MSHPPDHIPELDSPRQSRSPLKKGKKEQVSKAHTFNILHIIKSAQSVTSRITKHFLSLTNQHIYIFHTESHNKQRVI